ncbi:ABC transporter permease [Pusillimonas noertemannii]|uniref:Peptide/nickel transport system permease protein n=1 Tax=Pusillimonas noertemannii TaxID=305977 RepID=A0A2U1CLQ5_9BURK|nr:ABC transporter permease [Pusillimonas noertemannii]NYT69453.1 ABC transporter permease [Pusillimonas noertemannii]PVY61921.1 peptide/nickel transport system permease protein [Pusillimonas noertemannii]TFL09838.1 ABC transporter permease [Pusillimonas noertemannii]
MPKFTFLWTDVFIYCLVAGMLLYSWRAARTPSLRKAWGSVARTASAMCAAMVLGAFLLIGLLDSIHYRPQMPPAEGQEAGQAVYSPVVRSALDDVLSWSKMGSPEATYSAPLALRQFTKETQLIDGEAVRDYPRLKHAGLLLADDSEHADDLRRRIAWGAAAALAIAALAALLLTAGQLKGANGSLRPAWTAWWRSESGVPWRAMWITFALMSLVVCVAWSLALDYHVLGTDRTGNDVLRQGLKGVRTALVIGTLTTLAMLPPALFFGISAGYFKGRVDDVIQYLYTTLTSIPGVLLIAACVLMMQVYIDTNPELFPTVAARADLRLFLLCLILGLTGWAGLCRLLRAETLKLRELEYVQAARAFGVSHWRIMTRHLLPNLMHIVLITMVLEFSGLVLYEAVLSYLGIGVDPATPSFGTMIDSSRMEMSRDPMIWWNLLAAFLFMLALVLSANIFADAVQAAFDPRTRRFRPRLKRPEPDGDAGTQGASP